MFFYSVSCAQMFQMIAMDPKERFLCPSIGCSHNFLAVSLAHFPPSISPLFASSSRYSPVWPDAISDLSSVINLLFALFLCDHSSVHPRLWRHCTMESHVYLHRSFYVHQTVISLFLNQQGYSTLTGLEKNS